MSDDPVLANKIQPLLADQEMPVRGMVLAELFAIYLVDNCGPGNYAMYDEITRRWLKDVSEFALIYEKAPATIERETR